MVENVVAAVNTVIPGIPYVGKDRIALYFDEVVEVITELGRYGHGFEDALVAAVGQFRQVERHLGLKLRVAAVDALVEVCFTLVEVAFRHAVGRIPLKERI